MKRTFEVLEYKSVHKRVFIISNIYFIFTLLNIRSESYKLFSMLPCVVYVAKTQLRSLFQVVFMFCDLILLIYSESSILET